MTIKTMLWILFLSLAIFASICDRAILMDSERVAFYVVAGKAFYLELPFVRVLNFLLQLPAVLILQIFDVLQIKSRLEIFTWTYTLAPLIYLMVIDFFKGPKKEISPLFLPLLYLIAILPGHANQFSSVSEGVIVFALMMCFKEKLWIQYLGIIGLSFSHESSLLYLVYFMLVPQENKLFKFLSLGGIVFVLARIYHFETYIPNSGQINQIIRHPILPVIIAFLILPLLKKWRAPFFVFSVLLSLTIFLTLQWQDNITPHAFRNLSAFMAILVYEMQRRGFKNPIWTIIIVAIFTACFDIGLSLKYKEMKEEHQINFSHFKIKQDSKSKKEFSDLLREVESNQIVIKKIYYQIPIHPWQQLQQTKGN